MTVPYGPLFQMSFIVDDLEAAVAHWTTLGVGPFYLIERPQFVQYDYLGEEIDLEMSAAIGHSGELQIELIVQHNPEVPTIFTERRGPPGAVNHLCAYTDDLDESLAFVQARGGRRLQGGNSHDGSRICYVEIPGPTPIIIEFAQLTPPTRAVFEDVRLAAIDWDGSDPLRRFIY